jgi:heavy metal sensor kinase
MIVRSIRLSLVVYFLVLLAGALGAASWLSYATSAETLSQKQEAARKLIETQYDENCRKERVRLDDQLLAEAQSLARQTQTLLDWPRLHERERSLGMLALAGWPTGPNAHLTAPVWLAEVVRNPDRTHGPDAARACSPFYAELARSTLPEIHFETTSPDQLAMLESTAEFFQIDSAWGASYRSKSMGDHSFRIEPQALSPDQGLSWEWTDDSVGPDHPVRRVMLRTFARFAMPPYPRGPRPDERGTRLDFQPRSAIYVQCAASAAGLDAVLRGFGDDRDRKLAAVEAETSDSLAAVRNRLLLIGVLTFVAAAFGCYGLVRLGLSPLRRVSDAVSRVSTKDFRLNVDQRRMPGELKPIVNRVSETLQMLKRAFAREKQATADISHELRTPLAALLTTTEIALRKPRSAQEYQELLQDCRASAQQMTQAVERLLTLARLDAGVDRLRPQSVDAAEVAEQCAALVRPLAEARGLKLTVHRAGTAPLTTDPDKLREILTNLLHNAVEYNRPDGAIDVKVARDNGRLEVEVTDTGVGIGADAKAHLFERFFRADPSRTGDGLHAGLGLAIVKGYVDLMGGDIAVESTEGQGSTFRVRLPTNGQDADPAH